MGFYLPFQSIMKSLPAEEKAKIAKLNQGLNIEKNRLVTEVNKWDDESNEIISLSKKMCMLMMDMSDFTRFAHPVSALFYHKVTLHRILKILLMSNLDREKTKNMAYH